MDIQEKILKANRLNEEIHGMKDFISLARSAQIVDEKNARNNELNGVNRFSFCTISARISTGTQSPRYEKTMVDNEAIVCLITAGLIGVEEKLKDKEKELEELLKA